MTKLIDNTNYGMVSCPLKNGTFTPNAAFGTGTKVDVAQIGNVVFVQGQLFLDSGTLDDITGELGTISGVDAPGTYRTLPATTSDGQNTYHSGIVGVVEVLGIIGVYGGALTETDKGVILDFFYIV